MRKSMTMSAEKIEQRKANKLLTPKQLLTDPNKTTFNVAEVCKILGVGRTTINQDVQNKGTIINSVPALRVGKRIVFSATLLRNALGVSEIELTKKEGTRNE
jgi:hypothetical protein